MNAPVDVVYTWVDDGFPGYADTLRQYADNTHDLNPNRTRDNLQLLKFSLRALSRYAPWIRRVYLVTCRPQVPEWLDRRNERLTLVHHDEIMPAEILPTFNSFCILSHLDRIPGLSDRFLYFEDDMMLGDRLALSDLVEADGRIRVFPRAERTARPEHRHSSTTSPWNAALAHSNHLLDRAFSVARRHTVNHVPLLIDKTIWREMQAKWPDAFAHTCESRFRCAGNVAPEYLYLYYALYTGRAAMMGMHRTYGTSFYHGLENNRLIALYGRVMIRLLEPKLIALNDNFGDRPSASVVTATKRFLHSRYPDKSPFERSKA